MKPYLVAASLALLLNLSCSAIFSRLSSERRSQTAEQVVREFVMLSAASETLQDKGKLQSLCVGELRAAFGEMTDDMFRMTYLGGKLKVQDLVTVHQVEQDDAAHVRYQITVQNFQGTDPTLEINEREVDLIKRDGAWFINDIRIKGSDRLAFTRGMIF